MTQHGKDHLDVRAVLAGLRDDLAAELTRAKTDAQDHPRVQTRNFARGQAAVLRVVVNRLDAALPLLDLAAENLAHARGALARLAEAETRKDRA